MTRNNKWYEVYNCTWPSIDALSLRLWDIKASASTNFSPTIRLFTSWWCIRSLSRYLRFLMFKYNFMKLELNFRLLPCTIMTFFGPIHWYHSEVGFWRTVPLIDEGPHHSFFYLSVPVLIDRVTVAESKSSGKFQRRGNTIRILI